MVFQQLNYNHSTISHTVNLSEMIQYVVNIFCNGLGIYINIHVYPFCTYPFLLRNQFL